MNIRWRVLRAACLLCLACWVIAVVANVFFDVPHWLNILWLLAILPIWLFVVGPRALRAEEAGRLKGENTSL